ncbi:MAG: glycosyltransferase family 4 protein [Bacteroidia bacterium]|nr:glycosyltransferase family 4 protein [Bacteroidia bacterium]MCF8426403.1 glycosyltransferase family 4 protein [Bacteroidia bacterium]MCF8446171.1 glycosyltransferase family 4 protein [Bacteroidia bacterium]
MKKRIKVLMFGWEFPPVISGGLGVATLGLCKAMAPLADVKMIIPKNVPDFNIPNIELVGLNSIGKNELEELFKKEIHYSFPEMRMHKGAGFGPYTRIAENEFIDKKFYDVFHGEVTPFEIDDLYGGDVIKKVIEFARISVQYCLRTKFDVIHAHDWMTFLPAMELKIRTGKPLVLHVHSTEYDRAGEHSKNWVWDLEKRAMELADRIIPVSHYTGEICAKHYGVDPSKIMPVHNGIEAVKHTVKNKPFEGNLVIFFGRVTMQKGPEYFVEAARKVLSIHPNTKFVLAGSGDLLRPMIERTASYGIGDKFFFTGFLNKKMLNELLAIADVYCMPSVSEPFGLSAVEAVQYGIPTIISKTSGVAEVLNGSLKIDVWDVDKFAEYIMAALDYKGLKKSVVDANAHSLESITWENCAQKVMHVYQSIFDEQE